MVLPSPNGGSTPCVPTFLEMRRCAEETFGVRPCLWQLKVAEALLRGDKDVVCTAGTVGIQIVVTPLNLLGKQNATSLAKAGIRAIALSSETATSTNFTAIETFQYRAIIVSPEQLMKPNGEFEKRLKNSLFVSRIISIIIDEAHCLTDWGEFRPEYKELRRLRYILPSTIPIMITSATLTKDSLSNARQLLHMHSDKMVTIRRSSDRPNIRIGVKKIKYALSSYADLAFLIPTGWKAGDPPPPKFLIFFDDIQDAINAARYLRSRLPAESRDIVKWFNADMSAAYKEAELGYLVSGERRGFATTESFGMGMDVPDIQLVLQWRATCKLATLWQRFGRAARDKALTGTAILFAEKDFFDDERIAKATRKQKRELTRKRKANGKPTRSPPPCKRARFTAPPNPSNEASGSSGSNANIVTSHDGGNVEGDESDSDDSDQDKDNVPNPPDNSSEQNAGGPGVNQLKDAMAAAAQPRKNIGRAEKRRGRVLDPAMDYFINAENRPGLGCRRKVFDICFENDTTDADHLECNPDLPMGCNRCRTASPPICCDIHNPTEFTSFTPSIISKSGTLPPRSRVPKYNETMHDRALRDAIDEWREQKTAAIYGWHHLNDMGPSLIMCNSTVERIVDCAHHCKIHTIPELKKETAWPDADQLGNEVISLIQKHAAPIASPFVCMPLRPTTSSTVNTTSSSSPEGPLVPTPLVPTSNSGAASGTTKRKNKCSACGKEGHNARNQICPNHPSRAVTAPGKENVHSL